MKKNALAKLSIIGSALFAFSSTVYAQAPSDFWQSENGPAAALPGIQFYQHDSSIVTQIEGLYYKLVQSSSWVPYASKGPHTLASFPRSGVSVTSGNADTVYGTYKDTLYFSSNNGSSWKVLGSFGKPGTYSIRFIQETPSGVVLLFNDSGVLYRTTNWFATFDTNHIAAHAISIDEDTIIAYDNSGNIYRSIDYGMQWNLVLALTDPARNASHLTVLRPRAYFFARWKQLSTVQDTDLYMTYSTDGGASWTEMKNPIENGSPGLVIFGDTNRFYVSFDVGTGNKYYRSDDWGKTWDSITRIGNLGVTKEGYLYYANGSLNLVSTDHGNTWNTVNNAGLACDPLSMLTLSSDVYFSTSDSVFISHDDGYSWTSIMNKPRYLSLLPGYTDRMLMNVSTVYIPGSGTRSFYNTSNAPSGYGIVTSGYHVWISDQGSLYGSTDSGSSWSPLIPLSNSSIATLLETSNDTVIAASSSSIMSGYDPYQSFINIAPEQGVALPTGAMMKDSAGAIYAAMNDGKLFITKDGANTWQSFASPSRAVTYLAAGSEGMLFASDSTGFFEYDPKTQNWTEYNSGLSRQNFPAPAKLTNLWYAHNYVYAGTSNMGLFRSVKPVSGSAYVQTANNVTAESVQVYPNPASESVAVINIPSVKDGSGQEICIVDIAGRQWKRISIDHPEHLKIDIQDLPNGAYEVIGRSFMPVKLFIQH